MISITNKKIKDPDQKIGYDIRPTCTTGEIMKVTNKPKFADWAFQDTVSYAKKRFSSQGEMGMTFTGYTKNSRIMVFGFVMEGREEDKYSLYKFVEAIFYAFNIIHYTVLTEAWFSKTNKRPSQDPIRKEILMVVSTSYDRTRMVTFDIVKDGKTKKLENQSESKGYSNGSLTTLLPPIGHIFENPGFEQEFIDGVSNALGLQIQVIEPEPINIPDDIDD